MRLTHTRALTQVMIMRQLDHPNIVKLYETYEDEKALYLVLELCEGGDLFGVLQTQRRFGDHAASVCVRQMLSAVFYIHTKGIVHRDLKVNRPPVLRPAPPPSPFLSDPPVTRHPGDTAVLLSISRRNPRHILYTSS